MPTKSWIEVPIDQEIEGVPDEGYDPFYFPPEGAKLIFEFTSESFLRVLSALINGAALTYPDDWLQVVWDFLRNVEYPVSLCDEIAAAILTCEDVQLAIATLIGTPGPVQDAIEQLVTTSPEINEYITNVYEHMTPGQIIGKIAGGDCDNSVVAGRAIAIVERLDTNNTDALEILEVGTNDEERLSQILSAFPGFGILPLDELLDFAQDVLEDFAENYAAASTVERRDDMAEQIYCLMRESVDCSITWQQLFDFVKTKIPTAPFDILVTIGDILQFVGDGDFGNDELLFYGMMLLQLSTITASQNFNGLTAPLLSAITRDASPSSAWEDWDDCPSGQRVSIINGLPELFTAQTQTFIEQDGVWDVWDIYSAGFVGAPFTPGDGVPYSYGTNFKEEFNACIDVESVSGISYARSLNCAGALVEGPELAGSYRQIGTYSSSITTLRIKVKLSGAMLRSVPLEDIPKGVFPGD